MKKGLLLLFVLLGAIGLRAQDVTVVADSLKMAPDTTIVASGKAYYFAERSKQYPIRFIAEADGFLTLSGTQKISASSIRRNGASVQAGGSMNYTDGDGVKHTLDYFGAYTKESATGKISGIALSKGDVVECKVSTSVAPTAEAPIFLNVEFAEGTQPLTLVGVLPENGSEWSGSMKYKSYGVSGAIYCSFSSMIDIDAVKASVTVGDKVYTDVAVAVEGYYSYLHVKGLADTLKVAAAEGLIGAGDQFTVTLSGLKDRVFSDVVLEDQTFTYTMGNTSCTGVTPAASTGLDMENIQETVFNFDGKVNIDNAKFYLLSLIDSSKVELTATVDGVNLIIPVASAVEGLMPRRFDIIAEGVVDAKGNALTWCSTAKTTEEGKLKVHYGMSNTAFAPTFTPALGDTVMSLKTFTLTFPGKVIYNESLSNDLQVVLEAGNANSYSWAEVTTGTVEMAENGMEATITLAEEIKTPSDYRMLIPKFFFSELGYDAENLSSVANKTCYYYGSDYTYVNFYITPFEPEVVAPAPGSMVNKLDVIGLAFSCEIDVNDELEAVLVSNEMGTLPDTIAVGTIAYDYADATKATITLDKAIDSLGDYRLVIPAGAIFAYGDETTAISELSYEFSVDPDYWDPEWVVKASGTSEDSPVELIAGRKYEFSDMDTYVTYTATEDGRLYFNILDGRTYVDLSQCDETWWHLGSLKKTEEGTPWIGVEAGQTVYIKDYMLGGARQYLVTFEPGAPYDALQFTGTFPVDGGLFSKSTEAPESWENGAVEFYFSTQVNTEEVKIYLVIGDEKIDLSDDVERTTGAIDYGKEPGYLAVMLGGMIDEFKEEYGLKAGDKIQVVLENIQDKSFASNALSETLTVNLTLAATVCTSVNPNPSYGADAIPSSLSLRFDGNVTCANGKCWIIDVKSGNKQEFAIENLVCEEMEMWDGSKEYEAVIVLPEPTVELTSKKFAIQLEGLADTEGNVVSYGDEVGKFIINYKMRDDNFNYVTADPENGGIVTSMKSVKLTFADKVNLNPEAEAPYFWYGDTEVTGTMEVDPTDEKSVIITWSEEVTAAGTYYPTIPSGAIYNSKYDATKEDLGLEDGAGYNPYISLEFSILPDVSSTVVTSISPAPYEGWGSATINNLPSEVVIEFEGTVKEVVNAYGERPMWSTRGTDIPEDATPLDAKLVDNKVIVTIPAEVIAAITTGEFSITVNALGEDGKLIGMANDPLAENISFMYYVYKTLNVLESVPADGATVKELSTIELTFDGTIAEIDAYWEGPSLLNAETWEKVADLNYSFSGSKVTLSLAEPVTTAGQYIVYVPADIIYDEAYTANPAIELYVTVGEEVVADEDLAIVSATPENGASVATLTQVEFKLNKEVGYLEKGMLIGDNGEDAHGAVLTQSADDPTVYTLDFTYDGLYENVELKKGVTYTMTLTSWASEEACNYGQGKSETVTLTYVGDAEAFQYSDVTLESITPAEDFVISDKSQNKFVVKFSGAVEMVESLTYVNMGQGATQAFESIVASDDKTEYTLTIAEDVLATIRGTVNIVFAANDLNGKRVQGTNGENEYSTFAYYFNTTIGVPDLTVTPDAAVEQALLNTITIKCAEGIIPSWTAGNITLTDANGNAIALNDPEAVVAEGASEWATPTEWTVALKEELTAIGAYTLTIPAGYFNIGSTQGQIMGSKQTVVVFNITEAAQKAAGIKGVTADVDVVVYNVAGVAVANGKASEVLKNLTKGLYIVNGKKYVVK